MIKPNCEDLSQQKLMGIARSRLEQLVDNENSTLMVDLVSKAKSKTQLKIVCVEYDGGNSKY